MASSVLEAGELGKATLRELDTALSQHTGDDETKEKLLSCIANRKKTHRRKLKEKVANSSALKADEAVALYHQCAAELPATDSVLTKIEQTVFSRKRKKVQKALDGGDNLTLAQLDKLLKFCRQELAHDGTTAGKVQTAIDSREQSVGKKLRSEIQTLIDQLQEETPPTVRQLDSLRVSAAQELPATDDAVTSIATAVQNQRNKVVEGVEADIASAETDGPLTAAKLRPIVERCREQLPRTDATLQRVERLYDRQGEALGEGNEGGQESGDQLLSPRRRTKQPKGSKRRGRTKHNKQSGTGGITAFVKGVMEDLSGVNDSTSAKVMITVIFLMYMAVTLYTVQLALKVSPLEIAEDVEVGAAEVSEALGTAT